MATGTAQAETYGDDKFLVDGTSSHKSYLVIARRGDILLGIKMYGLTPGEKMNVPGKTYLFARVRSCRDSEVSGQMDNVAGLADKPVISLEDVKLNLASAWPNFQFEKGESDGHNRASLAVGVFLRGSLLNDPQTVLDRLKQVDMFQALAEYVVTQAGPQYAVQTPRMIAKWLREKVEPHLEAIAHSAKVKTAVVEAAQSFADGVEEEMVGMHASQLSAMLQKTVASIKAPEAGINPDDADGDQGGEEGEGEVGGDPDTDPDDDDLENI